MITSAEEFKRYAESEDEIENEKINESASDEVWFDVLSKYPELSRVVTANASISLNVLERLSVSDDVDVRWDVAMKRRINRSIFERLASDKEVIVRHRIACNPKVPKDILIALASDEDEMIAEAARKRL
ncbi:MULTISPECIES: hypothetical protein [Pseudomonas]|uniref:Leucine rich repeat variant n=1 Tax=Pseudomonas cichorii TaxID=36746 RepID=A0ABQ1DTQ5_PSECI|nr:MULTISPECIES: hypothetical protein [Pseudomonas]QVE16855.1 hypothetical protein KGD89_24000 [Pseudomonas cichorii]SDP07420.1 hypothetical protein SAMN05216599_1182 [Pseudomonas cichorii]GFM68538.1 hypothetical protein PSCICJ_46560 [Pseudomonas cichorii]GFM78873.1 hypothetical protein PSCICM_46920 [Pseudomonas cichorii]GFM94408.1 hypothetical protein PSCICP_43800 [Pseudomonas cichorii]